MNGPKSWFRRICKVSIMIMDSTTIPQKKSGIDWESFFIIKLSWKLYCVCMLKVQVKTAFYCIKPVNF